MSEYSNSYHLRTTDLRVVSELIEKSGRYGMILSSTGSYIPFVIEDYTLAPQDVIVEHNTHILLHYSFGEDHGCWIHAFDGSIEVARLSFVERRSLSPDPRARAIHDAEEAAARATLLAQGIIDERQVSQLAELAQNVECFSIGPQVATILDLQRVSWLSGKHLMHDTEEMLLSGHPDALFVNRAQRGSIPAPRGYQELMTQPQPNIALTENQEQMVQRHVRYWIEFGDFDEETQFGYWMSERYLRLLPRMYKYLPDQLMNQRGDEAALRATLRSIIGLTGPDVDWEPYLLGY